MTGSDVADGSDTLESLEFDDDERELLGLDNIDEVLNELDGEGVDVDEGEIPDAEDVVGDADMEDMDLDVESQE